MLMFRKQFMETLFSKDVSKTPSLGIDEMGLELLYQYTTRTSSTSDAEITRSILVDTTDAETDKKFSLGVFQW